MNWKSALAIYFIFWFFCLFLVLPFGVRTAHESGTELVPGQAESAPTHFDAKAVVIRTSVVSAVLFGLFYLNYVNGWITTDMLDWTRRS